MPEYLSALQGAEAMGEISVRDAGPVGMVQVKADLTDKVVQQALSARTGAAFPKSGMGEWSGDTGLLWMAPDEVLVMTARADAHALAAQIGADLAGVHHLALDVSDARAVIALTGPGLRDTLAKLTPADMSAEAMPIGRVRRTRLSQVAAAVWFQGDAQASVICFRSVARYAFDILADAAAGGPVGVLD